MLDRGHLTILFTDPPASKQFVFSDKILTLDQSSPQDKMDMIVH